MRLLLFLEAQFTQAVNQYHRKHRSLHSNRISRCALNRLNNQSHVIMLDDNVVIVKASLF